MANASRRFVLAGIAATPIVAAVPGAAKASFDPHAYIAEMRAIGMHVEPCHALQSFFVGNPKGMGDEFLEVSARFGAAFKADRRATARKVYLALCADQGGARA